MYEVCTLGREYTQMTRKTAGKRNSGRTRRGRGFATPQGEDKNVRQWTSCSMTALDRNMAASRDKAAG